MLLFSPSFGEEWILELINSVKTSKKYSNFPLLPLVVSHLYFALLLLVCHPFFFTPLVSSPRYSLSTTLHATTPPTTLNSSFLFFFKSRFFFFFSLRPPQTRGATTTSERESGDKTEKKNEWMSGRSKQKKLRNNFIENEWERERWWRVVKATTTITSPRNIPIYIQIEPSQRAPFVPSWIVFLLRFHLQWENSILHSRSNSGFSSRQPPSEGFPKHTRPLLLPRPVHTQSRREAATMMLRGWRVTWTSDDSVDFSSSSSLFPFFRQKNIHSASCRSHTASAWMAVESLCCFFFFSFLFFLLLTLSTRKLLCGAYKRWDTFSVTKDFALALWWHWGIAAASLFSYSRARCCFSSWRLGFLHHWKL